MTVVFLVEIAVPVTLVIVMATMGVNLVVAELYCVLRRSPQWLFISVLQFALLVPCAIVVVKILDVEPVIAMTLLAIAAAPGGTFSNIFTFLARGSLELSIVLTTASTVLSTFLSPFLFLLVVQALRIENGVAGMKLVAVARDLAIFVLFPVIVGTLISGYAPSLAEMIRRVSTVVASLAILCLIFLSAIVSAPLLPEALPAMFVAGGMLTGLSFGIGVIVSRFGTARDRSAITLEFAVRSLPIALILVGGAEPDVRMVAYLLSYFIANTTVSFLVSLGLRRRSGIVEA